MPKPSSYLLNKIEPPLTQNELEKFEEREGFFEIVSGIDRGVAEYLAVEEILKMREQSQLTGKSYIPDEISKLLNEFKTDKILNPAQDFIDNIQYYGVRLNEASLIISSTKEIFKIEDTTKRGLTPKIKLVRKSEFTADGIRLYMEGHKVNPSVLFHAIRIYIKRYVYLMNESQYDLLALYVMATYVFRIFRYFPYIHLYAEKGSGKTTLMSVLYRICFNGTFISNSTPATVFRLVEDLSPTLFIDEAEKLYKSQSDSDNNLIGVLNDGFSRESAIPRAEFNGESYGIRMYSAYSPKILASISEFDNVLRDRIIRIKMLRKKSEETVERYIETPAVLEEQNSLRISLYIFGLQFAGTIFSRYTDFDFYDEKYSHLYNRNADLWLPIMIIANLVDDNSDSTSTHISDNITQLSKETVIEKASDNSIDDINLRILLAVRKYITENKPIKEEGDFHFYTTDEIYGYVTSVEDFDRYFSKTKLSQILKKFGIENTVVKMEGNSVRAYIINPLKVDEILERYEL